MSNDFLRYFLVLLMVCLTINLLANDLIIGTTSAYAPYVSLNERGEYIGFDIEIAEALGNKLQRRIVIKDLGCMPSLLLALKQKKVDLIIWAISITSERQKQMEMIHYQGEKVTSLPMLFWKEIPEQIKSIEEMANHPKAVIAVEAGSFQESFLMSIKGLAIKQLDKIMDAILELKYGKSMATMIDPSLVSITCAQFPELKIMSVPLSPTQQSFGNGICINKNNSDLIRDVRRAISELKSDGTIDKLEKKWDLVGK